jgi:hypothetical protein
MRGPATLLLVLLAAPQSWEPFAARREVAPGGRHYVVLRAKGEPPVVSYELCRRRDGAAPLPPARSLPVTASPAEKGPDVGRDPGDEVVARGDLPQPPFQVRVLDGEPALVLFERYAALGTGDALALLGPDGRVRWHLRLEDLFQPAALGTFRKAGGDTWWFEAWWVDEERGTVVLCADGDRIGEVTLAGGKVRRADPAVLLARAAAGPAADRVAAMEIAARLLPEGVADLARRIAADGKEPLALRVRAAAALRRKGGTMDFAPLYRAAAAREADPEARAFAALTMAEVLGDAALPLLREMLRGEADLAWRPAMASLASLGEKAVPVLVEMLGEKGQSLDYRGGAAGALGGMKAASALPALWKAAFEFEPEKDEFHFVPQSALAAVVDIGPADLRARLLEALERGTPHDGRIAQWIAANPGKDALPVLRRALARWEAREGGKFAWEHGRIAAAIRACGD